MSPSKRKYDNGPDKWKIGMPQYIVRTFDDHQAPEHGWRFAVYDLRNAYDGDPVLAWCRTAGRAKKLVEALNAEVNRGIGTAGVS